MNQTLVRPRPGHPVYVARSTVAGRSVEVARDFDFATVVHLATFESQLTGSLVTVETEVAS